MTTSVTGYSGAAVFDGQMLLAAHVLLVWDGCVVDILPIADVPSGAIITELEGGILVPGFVDLQVNGGGGLMLNADPSVDALRTMAAAHGRLGATTILPTLITDHPDVTRAAIMAVENAIAAGVPGVAGLHLEGPHLVVSRKGAHRGDLIRPMSGQDLDLLCTAAQNLPVLKVTLAPESVSVAQISALAEAGVLVSLGHTDATFEQCIDATQAGARCVTHLFNAMSQLGSRAPGVVGAALDDGRLSVGVIADLVHVHPATLRLALSAKRGPGRVFLVSDAMAVAGTRATSFQLNGREITRKDGRLTLEDGTLAGADLDLARAIRNLHQMGAPLAEALAMATTIPGELIDPTGGEGRLQAGTRADFVHLDDGLTLKNVWRAGVLVEPA